MTLVNVVVVLDSFKLYSNMIIIIIVITYTVYLFIIIFGGVVFPSIPQTHLTSLTQYFCTV